MWQLVKNLLNSMRKQERKLERILINEKSPKLDKEIRKKTNHLLLL